MPSIRRGGAVLVVASAMGLLAAGCDTDSGRIGGTRAGFSSKPIAGATRQAVYQAALQEISQRFRISRADPDSFSIETQPQHPAGAARGQTGQFRVISSPSDLRQVARARVRSEEGTVRAEVSVVLQRRDTAQHRAYHSIRTGADVPHETPIETGANLEPERREVWTAYGRDYEMEQELLSAIAARLTGTTRPNQD